MFRVNLLRKTSATALILSLLFAAGSAVRADDHAPHYPRVFRTFMPEAGPSAFAVEMSAGVALCYDPLRGGVSQIWLGSIDRSPTLAAKINQPAKIVGEVFYRETLRYPLRLDQDGSKPKHRFKGYRYADGHVIFEFTVSGQLVSETLRIDESGRGLVREFSFPEGAAPFVFLLEDQDDAEVTVDGGKEVNPGEWHFAAGSTGTFTITPKKRY